MAVRVTQRPNRLASFFTAARQLVSEVESYFSSDEDGNLDRLELLEGRLEEACETLYVVIQRSEDLSSQNPNNLEMAQFNTDMTLGLRQLKRENGIKNCTRALQRTLEAQGDQVTCFLLSSFSSSEIYIFRGQK